MFKALNPYMLVAMEEIPITDIQPGPTPEKTFVYLDPQREENRGRKELRVTWTELCEIHFKARVNKRERIMTVPDMLLEYLAWVDKELGGWKTVPPRPWDPDSAVGRWFSPYLRVSGMRELRDCLHADMVLLRSMRR
ncbi:MAG: hypothetical protein ACOYCD_05980 [Kiritimatiellia bacterium]